MQLSEEQVVALKGGEPVVVSQPGVGDCIVIRADLFEQGRSPADSDEPDPADAYSSVLEAWDSMGRPEDADDYRT